MSHMEAGAEMLWENNSQSPFPGLKGFLVACICNQLSALGGFKPGKISVEQRQSLNAFGQPGGLPRLQIIMPLQKRFSLILKNSIVGPVLKGKKQSDGCLHKFTPNRLITATIFSKLRYRTAALFGNKWRPSIMANKNTPLKNTWSQPCF